jgi:catechol 2,3-dioxygenase-like lactoylglutathione lyase family enzyme
MSDLSGINHVTFLTADMDRLAAFYESVFGARRIVELPIPEGGRHALIDVGAGATLHPFELPIEPPSPQPMFARGRVDHFALNATDVDAFEVLRSRLVEYGATDGEVTDFGVMRVLTFTDPDGHTVELAHWVGGNDPAALDMSQASDEALTRG